MQTFNELQNWYLGNCNGEWEHNFGIKIGTLDNPGWSVEINLIGTKNEDVKFDKIKIERTENDWVHCWIENKIFNAVCGPLNLEEALEMFLKWINMREQRDCIQSE